MNLHGFENRGIRFEIYFGSPAFGGAGHGQFGDRIAGFVFLVIDLAVPPDIHFHEFRQGVDHGYAHAVQTAGHLIGVPVEFTTGVQFGQNNLHGGNTFGFMYVHRNTTAVVFNGDGSLQRLS